MKQRPHKSPAKKFALSMNALVALFSKGRYAEGEALARELTARFPQSGDAWKALGAMLMLQGKGADARFPMQKAVELLPGDPEAHNNLGNVLRELGLLTEAEASLRQAISLQLDYAEAHNNLGNTLNDQGRLKEAEASYGRALCIRPDYPKAYNNLGVTLREQGRLAEAEESYRRALSFAPDYAEVHNALGNALREQGRLAEGEESLRQAISLKPDLAEAHSNLAVTLQDAGRLIEAEESYRRALAIRPDYPEAHSNLLFALNYTPGRDRAYYLEEAMRFGQVAAGKVGQRFSSWQCARRPERLRVGLVSGDLHEHPVGYFLESVLARIDSARIELVAYSTDRGADALTARIMPCFSAWRLLTGLSDEAAARMIHEDAIHVLVDCSGHTGKNRLPLFAWKPAPVQASWPGYFAGTGVAEMDYLIGDPYVTPPEEEGHFTETVWRLPETYLCFTPPETPVDVGPLPALKSGSVTFASFNSLAKMNDAVVALWTKVLNAVPHARLFLKAKQLNDPRAQDAVRGRFGACGIAPDRLLLEGASPRAEMLKAYNRVDMILSPFPYPGGTTSVEGMWMGVPAITRKGDYFLPHIGESIAHNAGLADWIAQNDEDYVAKAITYAKDLTRLAALRATLREQVLASPLFDAPRFARHLEGVLWGMWERLP